MYYDFFLGLLLPQEHNYIQFVNFEFPFRGQISNDHKNLVWPCTLFAVFKFLALSFSK